MRRRKFCVMQTALIYSSVALMKRSVRTATCCICSTGADRSGSSDSDVLKEQPTAQFRCEHAQGCVWTDLYWDSNSTWLSDGLDGFVLGLKQHVAQ